MQYHFIYLLGLCFGMLAIPGIVLIVESWVCAAFEFGWSLRTRILLAIAVAIMVYLVSGGFPGVMASMMVYSLKSTDADTTLRQSGRGWAMESDMALRERCRAWMHEQAVPLLVAGNRCSVAAAEIELGTNNVDGPALAPTQTASASEIAVFASTADMFAPISPVTLAPAAS